MRAQPIDRKAHPELAAIVERIWNNREDDLFSLSLGARTLWALGVAACQNDSPEQESCYTLARLLAGHAGYWFFDKPAPLLLLHVDELHHEFVISAEAEQQEQAERESRRQSEERDEQQRIKVEALLKGNDWKGLGLSTPSELVAQLLAGESPTINGHSISYEANLDVTWICSPYGVDGVLCSRPTLENMTAFLVDMAHDRCYGPTP